MAAPPNTDLARHVDQFERDVSMSESQSRVARLFERWLAERYPGTQWVAGVREDDS